MKRAPTLRLQTGDLVVDNFAGGGGASLGMEWALGRSPDIAVNHDPEALAMHCANHPSTRHLLSDVWDVDPIEACAGRRVALAWFSPDCTHHSKAKGSKPRSKKIRSLAFVAVRWANAVKPRVIALENVEEFEDWGPLLADGTPDPSRRGLTFRRWVGRLRGLGYAVEWRELRACDFGAPTTRKRLFVAARCDGEPIRWPSPTHGRGEDLFTQPYRTAAECIDWTIPCPSIFDRKRPLAEATLRRIARGVHRYVLEAAQPFLLPVRHGGDARVWPIDEPMRTITAAHRGEIALAVPTLIQTSWGERQGQAPRVPGLEKPLGTVVAGGVKHALVAAFLAKGYSERTTGGWNGGADLMRPCGAITVRDHHALMAAFLTKFYGTSTGQDLRLPAPTVTAEGWHLGEVRALLERHHGASTQLCIRVGDDVFTIVDVGMRMLEPRELFRAQGFPDSYVINVEHDGEPLSKTAQIRMCGNSVSPPNAAAIVRANILGEQAEAA